MSPRYAIVNGDVLEYTQAEETALWCESKRRVKRGDYRCVFCGATFRPDSLRPEVTDAMLLGEFARHVIGTHLVCRPCDFIASSLSDFGKHLLQCPQYKKEGTEHAEKSRKRSVNAKPGIVERSHVDAGTRGGEFSQSRAHSGRGHN